MQLTGAEGLMKLEKKKESEEEEQSKERCHPVVVWGKTHIKNL